MSLIAAITIDKVISYQVIEGAVDSSLFDNYIYQTLRYMRRTEAAGRKDIVLLMDNAVIHRHSSVLETARNFKVNVLFNAEYSPWLNPIEQLFS
jgi:transposase